MMNHQNWFCDVFGKRRVRDTSCFLPHQKILIVAKVMAGWRSAPKLMSDSIAHGIFNRDSLKILIFELRNLSSPTFFSIHLYIYQSFSLGDLEKNSWTLKFKICTGNYELYKCDRKSEKHTFLSILNLPNWKIEIFADPLSFLFYLKMEWLNPKDLNVNVRRKLM
jgi:hypothetical protein